MLPPSCEMMGSRVIIIKYTGPTSPRLYGLQTAAFKHPHPHKKRPFPLPFSPSLLHTFSFQLKILGFMRTFSDFVMLGKKTKTKQRSPSLVWLFKSGAHGFSPPPSSLNVSMRRKVTTCAAQMSANVQHLAQTCTRLRVRGYYLEHCDMKSRNHPVRGENGVCGRSG